MRLFEALCHLTWIKTRLIAHRLRMDKHAKEITELNRAIDRLQEQANWNVSVNEANTEALKHRMRRLENLLTGLDPSETVRYRHNADR